MRRPELDETYRYCSLESIVCPCQPMVSFASINGIKSLFFTENNPSMFYGQEKVVAEMIPFHFCCLSACQRQRTGRLLHTDGLMGNSYESL